MEQGNGTPTNEHHMRVALLFAYQKQRERKEWRGLMPRQLTEKAGPENNESGMWAPAMVLSLTDA